MLSTRKVKHDHPQKMESTSDCISSPFSSLFGPKQRWHGTMWQRLVKPNAVQTQCHRRDLARSSTFDSASHIHQPGSVFVLHHLACDSLSVLGVHTDTKGNSAFNVRGLKVQCPLRGWMDFRSLLQAGFSPTSSTDRWRVAGGRKHPPTHTLSTGFTKASNHPRTNMHRHRSCKQLGVAWYLIKWLS